MASRTMVRHVPRTVSDIPASSTAICQAVQRCDSSTAHRSRAPRPRPVRSFPQAPAPESRRYSAGRERPEKVELRFGVHFAPEHRGMAGVRYEKRSDHRDSGRCPARGAAMSSAISIVPAQEGE